MNKRSIISFGVFVALLGVVISSYFAHRSGHWRFNNPSLADYPIQGLDVSHHQAEIDWAKVPVQQYRFVFIKASEGSDFRDHRFLENWQDARKYGFQVGAYHFFTLCRDGGEQAHNFIDTVPQGDSALPPVVDLEYVGNCSKRPSSKEFDQNLQAYLALVEQHYGRKPFIYTTYDFYADYLRGDAYMDYPVWIRDIFSAPDDLRIRNWAIWQFADNLAVPGIQTPVDGNVMKEVFWKALAY